MYRRLLAILSPLIFSRVTAENGVSEQDPDSKEGRTAVTTGTTTEGGG